MKRDRSGPSLARGDLIGVVAPGFAVKGEALEEGLQKLRNMGFRVIVAAHTRAREGYFAGDDASRVADLNTMLRNPEVRGIWSARGGFGTARLLEDVDWKALRRNMKVLVGYSDLTALFATAQRWGPGICLYGPVVSELGTPRAYHAPSLRALLAGGRTSLPIRDRQVLRPGRGRGRLAGGNLTVLVHLLGTRYEPDLQGAIVFLEDTPEETYRLDRLLTHLRMSGILERLAGVLLGSFDPPPTRRAFPPDRPLLDLFRETFVPLGVPVVTGIPAGHMPRKWTLPLGGAARIDTAARVVEFAAEPWPKHGRT